MYDDTSWRHENRPRQSVPAQGRMRRSWKGIGLFSGRPRFRIFESSADLRHLVGHSPVLAAQTMTSVTVWSGHAAIRGALVCIRDKSSRDETTRPAVRVLMSDSSRVHQARKSRATKGRHRRDVVGVRASTGSNSPTAPQHEPAREAFTEPYSFFNLATAEFPEDWGNGTAKVRYQDSQLDLALMAWFSRKIAMAIKVPPPKNISYDEFIALCFLQMRGRDFNGQRDITFDIMTSLMPPGGDKVFRRLFPVNKFSLELNAVITKMVFAWMVGPMEVRATSDNDLNELLESRVHIKKCRWLQESGCTAMCANMCKTATQDFFTDVFGLPLTIKPNFEDKSCDFYFGKTPPPIAQDEALLFGCNALCKTGEDVGVEGKACHKLRPYEGEGVMQ